MKLLKKTLAIFLSILTIITTCSATIQVFAENEFVLSNTIIDETNNYVNMTSKIKSEVIELREEYAKHFVCEDGSYIVASYTEPIHYKENGQWKEIDNSLKLTTDIKSSTGQEVYIPKAGMVDVKIPQSFSNGQKLSATNKGYSISFSANHDKMICKNQPVAVAKKVEELSSSKLIDREDSTRALKNTKLNSKESEITIHNNEAMAVKNQTGAVVYENVFGNDDLEYIVTTNSIKENIVVNEKQSNYTYSFDMDFGELIPVVNEDNSIRVVEPGTEETIFFVTAPYMYDANGVESTDIDMLLVEENGIYVLTLYASIEWINAPERVFPVIIDPTVCLSYSDVFVMDGLINKNTTKVNKELRVGRNLTNLTRTYIKPSLPSNIPQGSHISSAYIILKQDNYYQALSANDVYIRAYDCDNVDYWESDSITWNNQPFDNSVNGYKNNSGDLFLSACLAKESEDEYCFNITNSIRRWSDTGIHNGIVIVSSNEASKTQVDFFSSRADDSNNYPEMYISYTAPNVTISSWETDSLAKESPVFDIVTEKDWNIYSDVDWISFAIDSGTGFSGNYIVVEENESLSSRSGTVTVKMGDTIIGTIAVTQYGADPQISLDTTSLNFNVGGGAKTVNITSNTTWSFSNLPEWITVTPSEGSMDSTVEIEVSVNNDSDIRESNITVTADTVTKTINVTQLKDTEDPAKPDIYEEDGLVYISSRTFDFDEGTETEEHIEYSLDGTNWSNYTEPLNIVRTYGATVYAKVVDEATNESPIAEITLENNFGEYTASYTDIALGEGLFPVEFGRTYTSAKGWFFTFDANVVKIDDNAYLFTDFYGEKQYFIKNGEGKYLSIDDEELTINADSYVLTYGDMTCTFDLLDGKINRITTDYLDTQYTWNDDGTLTITGGATVTFDTDGNPTNINITRTDSEGTAHTKEVDYVWTEGNLTKFIDAADVEHIYAYDENELLTTNDTETISYSNGRVKLISQPNGAFVKYTYDDSATNSEAPNNVGAVTVSDSKGVTDTWYYADGVYISNTLGSYSDNAVYAPESIANKLVEYTTDNVADVFYVVTEDTSDENNETSETTSENTADEEADETIAEEETTADEGETAEEEVTEETVAETPLYEEIDENTYAFYTYDEQKRVTAELEVLKANITDITTATFESAEAVAESKVTYAYVSDEDDSITVQTSYIKSQNGLAPDEKECYTYENGDILTHSKYKYVDIEEILLYDESYEYNDYGNVATHTETQYATSVDAFDVTYTTSYTYDVWCMCTGTTLEYGNNIETATTEYDLNGVTLSVTYDEEKVSYIYTDSGFIKKETVTDVISNDVIQETIYEYDDFGNLESCENPDGDTSYYEYDDYGNLTNHNFNGYFFTYNTLGSILTASVNDDVLVTYTYESAEQELSSVQYANGQTLNYAYDEATGDLLTVSQGEDAKFSYSYSTVGEDEITTLTDSINSIIKVIENDKVTVKADADTVLYSVESLYEDEETPGSFNGKKITVGSDIYTLKSEENKDSFYVGETEAFVKTYENDYAGNLWKVNTGNAVSTQYGYNEDKNISTLKNTLNGLVQTFGYGYDDEGNITTETLNIVTSNEVGATVETNQAVNYTYDEYNQLKTADYGDVLYEYIYDNSDDETAEFDHRGNITKKIKTVGGVAQAVNYVYDTQWKDKLISYNGQSISYDVVGNPVEYLGDKLTWTMGRQLAEYRITNGTVEDDDIIHSYTYNEDGIRTSKTVNTVTTTYYLDGTNIIEQITGDTVLHFHYDSNDEIIGFTYNEADYFYIKNAMSDIIGIVDNSGNLVVSYAYDAWGKVLSVTGSNTELGNLNPFRYRSYYYDTETEFYYLQSRYYDPEVCRFINSDDVNFIGATDTVGSYNAFAYCENEPASRVDYTGTCYLNSDGKICHTNSCKDKYVPKNAINYAEKWWNKRNKDYYKYLRNGDCANFVSQCLYAGGKKMNDSWHSFWASFKPSKSRKDYDKWDYDYKKLPIRCYRVSNAWGTAKGLYKYLKKSYNLTTYKNVDKLEKAIKNKKIKVGDVAFLKNKEDGVHHAMIIGRVVNTKNKKDCYYYAHTTDRNANKNNSSVSNLLRDEEVIIFNIK